MTDTELLTLTARIAHLETRLEDLAAELHHRTSDPEVDTCQHGQPRPFGCSLCSDGGPW